MNQVLQPNRQIVSPFRGYYNGLSKKGQRQFNARAFANDFSVLQPTIWAQEAILQLLPNMVTANLIARDFNANVAKFGDIVNAYVPGVFAVNRKGALCDPVVVQDASGTAIQVPLDQWPQVSFMICDGEENRNQIDLLDTLLTPAVIALAQQVDQILNAQVTHFLENSAGHLGLLDSTNVRDYVLRTREVMNRNNVPLPGRTMLLTPGTETSALEVDAFTLAQDVGDNGTALREAALGRKYGFDLFMTQTLPEVAANVQTIGQLLINNVAGYPAGTTTNIAIDGTGAGSNAVNVKVGMWLTIAGDDVPHQVTVNNGDGTVNINTPLLRAIADEAIVTIEQAGLVNTGTTYPGTTTNPRAIGWIKEIVTDTWTAGSPPHVGQLVTFGSDTNRYTILKVRTISSTEYGITLDRPLVTALTNNTVINIGPAGKFNWAFLRNALTMITAPLPQPRTGTGAISRVVSDPVNKITIRVTVTYDGTQQGHLVTLDFLMGVGILSENQGAVMLG